MYETCLDCVVKHLGRALALMCEVDLGYPQHRAYAVGEISMAETELVEEYPDIANAIRLDRVKMQEDDNYKPQLRQWIDVVMGLKNSEENE